MDWKAKVASLEARIETLHEESKARNRRLVAISDQIDILQKRAAEFERSTEKNFKYMDDIFDIIGSMLYPIYYKIFPGALDADNWLDRIVKRARKKPPS
jgi:hypothetical protein